MKAKAQVLDVVAVVTDEPSLGLVSGQVGTVVMDLGRDIFEVEFCDDEGRAYAQAPLGADRLLVLHYESRRAA